MKWMIASDIHGSAYWCRRMTERFDAEGADRLLLLGDLLYHGPRNDLPQEYAPKKVIEMLNAYKQKIFCVRGNCEAEVDQMVLDFPCLADYMLLPVGERMLFATHGHLYDREHLPPLSDGDIFLQGHTHIPVCMSCGQITVLNPGSVSIPKADSPHSYMLLEGTRLQWKDMDGHLYNEAIL